MRGAILGSLEDSHEGRLSAGFSLGGAMTEGPSVWLETLGCAKNQVDSEKVRAMLSSAGYREAAGVESADVVMVNTCAFIEAARQESIDTIMAMSGDKRFDAGLVVMGCMAQRYETELVASLPEADAVLGLDRYSELVGKLDQITKWTPLRITSAPTSNMDILYRTARPAPLLPYAYVKIAEGCDKGCTFCAIPQFRGKQRSRAPANIRQEIAALAAQGVGEIVLVAQDLAAYGRDINAPGKDRIVDLLRFIGDVEGIRRIRLYYLYPREIRPALIEEIATNPLLVDYFDLSLQHAAPALLRAMKRPGSGDSHLSLIESIRQAAPKAAMRSSFIVGFPGETEEDVEHLASFLQDAQLDWAGFFPFSAEEGTAAVDYPDQIEDEAKAERVRYLSATQDDITAARNAAQVGTTFEVLVDQVEDGKPVGRTYRHAPEIDGVVLLDRGNSGEWIEATVTGAYGYDLVAQVVD